MKTKSIEKLREKLPDILRRGTKRQQNKLPNELDKIWLGDVYEVIPCTQEAMDSIVKAGEREQE